MTAGAGILPDELTTERMYRSGWLVQGVQLGVNLAPGLKMTQPRYQTDPRRCSRPRQFP
jgi:redox-sensitive bicupin YhaK (pirin superfamily)